MAEVAGSGVMMGGPEDPATGRGMDWAGEGGSVERYNGRFCRQRNWGGGWIFGGSQYGAIEWGTSLNALKGLDLGLGL